MKAILRRMASSAVWAFCRLLPVQENKVVFCSFGGKGFGDNPKAVALALLEADPSLDLVWLTRNMSVRLPKGIRPCPFGTPQAVKELSTAKVWVDNSRGGARYKKKNQYYLQTWHGFALKCIEAAAENKLPPSYVRQCMKDSSFIDLIVSNSRFMTEIYQKDFWYDGAVEAFGSPRNDVFFRNNDDLAHQVRDFFALPQDRHFLLYAPTFRDDGSVWGYALDAEGAVAACEKRFGGKWSALIRLHPNAASQSADLFPYDGNRILDATAYPDMQELLITADLLITDYSSSMFDYALSGKPCVQFAVDIEAYERDRNFYMPLDSLPFPLARSNEELLTLLQQYDLEENRKRWTDFAEAHDFQEDGQASARCAQWILRHMKGM